MTDAQINGLLIFAFVFALAGAVALWVTLALRRHRDAGMIGWLTTALVVAGAAATWKLRHGGSGFAALAAGGLGFVATLVVFFGADARVKITRSMFPPSRRSGSPTSRRYRAQRFPLRFPGARTAPSLFNRWTSRPRACRRRR